ncbi:poly glycohydrolase [Planoprotostelium fungivorum]|uniref:poly(ADP-ribose) glycohydrolase n=1 Tax=Planoprotostelium fungivorum TaxID=1890364 RepID=A0A2P6NFQ0_9EUKA|nr:poly glycohydrolase [Planoprotostelium fungivorum]
MDPLWFEESTKKPLDQFIYYFSGLLEGRRSQRSMHKKSSKKRIDDFFTVNSKVDQHSNEKEDNESDHSKSTSKTNGYDTDEMDEAEINMMTNGNTTPNSQNPEDAPERNITKNVKRSPTPFPPDYIDCWDSTHTPVFSSKCIYDEKGRREIITMDQNSNSIIKKHSKFCRFRGFHSFFNDVANASEVEDFFLRTLPKIIDLALRIPEICPKPIRILLAREESQITLTQLQIACLLSNAFLCTFPLQGGILWSHSSTDEKKKRRVIIPESNFDRLYAVHYKGKCSKSVAAKLRCILHYFDTITTRIEGGGGEGKVTFRRNILEREPQWTESRKVIGEMVIDEESLIEDCTGKEKYLEMDFANRMIGGGVLGKGCIQEEIRFCINTELLVSTLFTERFEDHECAVIKGAERFSNYSGEEEDEEDTDEDRDEQGRIETWIVALDAMYFGRDSSSQKKQLQKSSMLRELNKARLGFQPCLGDTEDRQWCVVTGNWGCGVSLHSSFIINTDQAFGGYQDLKAVLQLMAAAEAEVKIWYCTFGVPGLAPSLKELVNVLKKNRITVSCGKL